MTWVNNGAERREPCRGGTAPVTSDATVSSDTSHLTHADVLDNCFSQIQSPDCFLVSGRASWGSTVSKFTVHFPQGLIEMLSLFTYLKGFGCNKMTQPQAANHFDHNYIFFFFPAPPTPRFSPLSPRLTRLADNRYQTKNCSAFSHIIKQMTNAVRRQIPKIIYANKSYHSYQM